MVFSLNERKKPWHPPSGLLLLTSALRPRGGSASFTRQSLAPFLRLWTRRLGNSPANSPKVMLRGSLLASSRRANTQLKNKGFLWKPSLKPHLSLMRYFQQWKPRLPPHCRSDVHTLQFSKENRSSLESPTPKRRHRLLHRATMHRR